MNKSAAGASRRPDRGPGSAPGAVLISASARSPMPLTLMPRSGSQTLSDLGAARLEVACEKCGRKGLIQEVTPPRKPSSKRPNARTVILLGIALGLALLLAIMFAVRYL